MENVFHIFDVWYTKKKAKKAKSMKTIAIVSGKQAQ